MNTSKVKYLEKCFCRWFVVNQQKVRPGFWWYVLDEYVSQMLEETGLSPQDYDDFCQWKAAQYGQNHFQYTLIRGKDSCLEVK